jgi:hypothetical protein
MLWAGHSEMNTELYLEILKGGDHFRDLVAGGGY